MNTIRSQHAAEFEKLQETLRSVIAESFDSRKGIKPERMVALACLTATTIALAVLDEMAVRTDQGDSRKQRPFRSGSPQQGNTSGHCHPYD